MNKSSKKVLPVVSNGEFEGRLIKRHRNGITVWAGVVKKAVSPKVAGKTEPVEK